MTGKLPTSALDQLFLKARSHNKWHDKLVADDVLHELVALLKMGPTSANCSPARLLFVKTPEAKARLFPHVAEGNREKVSSAPVCAIVAHDLLFFNHLPQLFPHTDAKSWFEGNDDLIATTAFRNGSLQGAYLILAARALGLDTGPMSGFDNAGVDREFFPEGTTKSNFLCALGYGDADGLFPRAPRFAFDEMARIL